MERQSTTIQLTIDTCVECPYCKKFRSCLEDVENCFDYYCGMSSSDEFLSMKMIAKEVMQYEDMPDVPEWCPLRIN